MNLPNSENEVAVSKTTVGPEDPKDSPSLWEKFVDGVWRIIYKENEDVCLPFNARRK